MAKVLVVDDDPSTRQMVRDLLETEGYDVAVAEDGFAALRQVQSSRPDCVLLDVMMPGIDGHAVLARLRDADGGGRLPVLMLTAMTDDEQAWRAWSEGADVFLTKPFDTVELLRAVEELCRLDSPPRRTAV